MSSKQRIVSLCPSLTETIFELGAGDRLVGITEWCVHPIGDVDTIQKVGGTKTPELNAIFDAQPDLVVVNEEENRIEDVREIEARGIEVLNTFPRSVSQTVEMVQTLAAALSLENEGQEMIAEIEVEIEKARAAAAGDEVLRVVYLIWRGPFMAVNRDTYIHDLLALAGAENLCASHEERYPRLDDAELKALGADMVLLCSEPFPFTAQYAAEIRSLCGLPSKHAPIVDGEYFSWYGARTAAGVRYAVKKLKQLRRIRAQARGA